MCETIGKNYYYREAIVEAMDIGLYGDSDHGIITMYKILNGAYGKRKFEIIEHR